MRIKILKFFSYKLQGILQEQRKSRVYVTLLNYHLQPQNKQNSFNSFHWHFCW